MVNEHRNFVGLFAGVGGIESGFEQAGFTPVLSNEIDLNAARTFEVNNKHAIVVCDIASLESEKLPHELSVLAGGFPCQPFSVAGYRKGFQDKRGNVFWEIDRLYKDTSPSVVFLENVKNLQGHDQGKTYKTIVAALEDAGYYVHSSVLNAKEYGNIPQNRERIYIVAFKDANASAAFKFPSKLPLTSTLADFIDFENKVDDEFYYTPRTPFWNELESEVTEVGIVYQWRRKYVRANKSGVCPTLTANMGMGGHNVPIVKTKHGIRKLTPAECFSLMGFSDFKFPQNISKSQLYKQAGNSVVVPVIKRIAQEIDIALKAAS